MNIIFINNKLFFLSVILAFIAGCSDGSKSSGGPVVGIADLSPGIAVSSSVDLEEGDDGSQIAAVGFTASTDGIVNYTTYDIDAVAKSDYLPQSGQYEMQAGQSYEIGIEILSDTRVEADEKVGVLITDESGEELGRLVATILNDDYPNYTLTASDITEGHLGAQFLEFTIELSEPTVAPFPLSVTTTDLVQVGSALAGTDYTAINTQLVFVAGELTKTIEVEVFGDRDIELDETIELKVEHLAISEVVASGTIRSDDTPGNGAPTFRFNEGRSITIAENGTPEELVMKFKIDESGGFTEDFVVNYRLASLASDVVISGDETGKAEEEQDFSTAVGKITILAAQDSLDNEYTASFELVDDELLENNEVLEMVLFNDAGVEFGSGRIYIVDDESPEFKIYRKYTDLSGEEQITTDLTYLEDSDYLGRREFYVELAGQVGYDYQFELVLRYLNDGEEGNAIDPDDVQGSGGANQKIISKIIDIEKGNSFSVEEGDHIVSFSMEEDSLVEANERMMIELRSSNGGTLGEAIPVNILNDDLPVIRWANTDFSTDAFESNEETPLNLILQLDNDELPADQQYGDSALEDFDISIVRSITQGSESKACSVKTQSDLSTEELTITTEGLQVYSVSSNSVPVILAFVDDTDAECDEVVDLTVTLKSQSSRVNEYLAKEGKGNRSDQVTVTSKNTDEATLTITGFNVTEDLDGGVVNFTAILNQDITLSAAFSVSSDGAEAGGADDNGDGVITYNTNPITFDVANTFEFSGGVKERNISIAINNDSIVEIDENYILNVVMDDGYPVKLASISTVTTKTCGAIGLGCLHADDEIQTTSVEGKIVSEDKVQISIEGGTTIDESALDVGKPTYPFTVSFRNEIADDVPDIILELTSKCPVLTSDICAEDGDFIRSDTSLPKIEATLGVASAVLGLSFYNDDLVEASEIARLQVSLKNASALSEYVDSWSNIDLTYAITNDDKIKPYFIGTVADNKISKLGSETDIDNSPSILVSWDEDIAKNIPDDLSLVFSSHCESRGCESDDFTLINTQKIFTADDSKVANLAAPGMTGVQVGLTITGGTMVEPDELLTLSISSSSNAQYFDISHYEIPEVIVDGVNYQHDNSIEYTIENDDAVKPYFIGTVSNNKLSLSESETDEDHSASLSVSWDEIIAKNVEDTLTLVLQGACEARGCESDDYTLTTDKIIFTADASKTENLASPGSTGVPVSLIIKGGTMVEPSELLTLSFSGSTNDKYVDITHHKIPEMPGVNVTYLHDTVFEYTIENNDKIKPYFVGTLVDNKLALAEPETAADHTPSISIGWDEAIAKNVSSNIVLVLASECESNGCESDDFTLTANQTIFSADNNRSDNQAGPDDSGVPIVLTIKGGTMVEPDELLTLSFSGTNSTEYFDINHFKIPSVIVSGDVFTHDTEFEYTIENDDEIKPYFIGTVVDNKISKVGSEMNSDNVPNILVSWDEDIAKNIPDDLSLIFSSYCESRGCESDDFILINTQKIFTADDSKVANLTAPGMTGVQVGLTITGGTMVEPDELLTLSISSSSNAQYFDISHYEIPEVIVDGVNYQHDNSIEYTIENDDAVKPYFIGTVSNNKLSLSESETDEDHSASLSVSWDEIIAKNVEDTLTLVLQGACEARGCESDDYTLTTDKIIFTADASKTENLASPGSTGVPVSLIIKGGTMVEPSELLTLSFSGSTNDKYVDITHHKIPEMPGVNVTYLHDTVFEYTIENNDKIKPYFVGTLVDNKLALAEPETAADHTPSISIGWDEAIAKNVSSNIVLVLASECESNGCESDDFTLTANQTIFSADNNRSDNQAGPDDSGVPIVLAIKGGTMVEPDELLTLSFSGTNSTEYFDINHFKIPNVIVSGDVFTHDTKFEYTIENDDITVLTLQFGNDQSTIVAEAAHSLNEGDSSTLNSVITNTLTSPYYIHTSLAIAPNVPTLNISFETLSDDDVALCSAAAGEEVVCANDSSDYTLTHLELGNETDVVDGAAVPVAIDAQEERSVPFRIVGESEWVERHEKVVFRVDATVPTGYALSDYATISAPSTVTHTISNDDKINLSLHTLNSADAVVDLSASAEFESTVLSAARSASTDFGLILRGDKSIAANVPSISYSFSALSSTNAATISDGSNNDFAFRKLIDTDTLIINSLTVKDTVAYAAGGDIDFLLTYYDDNVVEFDEKINYSFTIIPVSGFNMADYAAEVPANTKIDFTISNEDMITFALPTSANLTEFEKIPTASLENDVALTFAFESPADSIDSAITVLTVKHNLASSGSSATQEDFSSNELGKKLTTLATTLGSLILETIKDDVVIETTETFQITNLKLFAGDAANKFNILSIPTNGETLSYNIVNDDFVTVSLKDDKRVLTESSDAIELNVTKCTGCTLSSDAKNAEFSITQANISVIDYASKPVPAADLTADLTSVAYSNKLANFDTSDDTSGYKNTLISTTKQDNIREPNEWFSLYVTQESLCPDTGCFGADIVTAANASKITDVLYPGLSDEGFMVIVNDEYVPSADTGIVTCLEISGGVAEAIGTTCSTSTLQDVEIQHEVGKYTFVDTDGALVRPSVDGSEPTISDYQCIQDNYIGSLWDLNSHDTESVFSDISIATEYCGKTDVAGAGGTNWQLPTVSDLINILDFNSFVVDGTNRFKNRGSYWTRDACLADLSKYWVVDMATGTTTCQLATAAATETNYVYAVYY
jgi:hypothetical protein